MTAEECVGRSKYKNRWRSHKLLTLAIAHLETAVTQLREMDQEFEVLYEDRSLGSVISETEVILTKLNRERRKETASLPRCRR